MAVNFVETYVNKKKCLVPAVEVQGQTVIVKGKRIKTAVIRDEEVVLGEPVKDPQAFIAALKNGAVKADVFTFAQRPPEVTPKHKFVFDWDNIAAVPITTFEDWWEKRLPQEARKNIRRAAKRGVVVKSVPFDDELARGIHKLYNETTIRQGRPFWHYGKDFETVKQELLTYAGRSEFIGAYFENELIGFIKLVYVDHMALIFHIFAGSSHHDKRPMNALIAKAVEICAQKGVSYFVYGLYAYGNKKGTLMEFKRRNGFEQINFPRYYIPLTLKGRLYVGLRLYRGLSGVLPGPVIEFLLKIRARYYQFTKTTAAAKED